MTIVNKFPAAICNPKLVVTHPRTNTLEWFKKAQFLINELPTNIKHFIMVLEKIVFDIFLEE